MDKVHIRLLGGFTMEYGGRPLPPIPGVGQSLLAYLSTYSGRWHTRDLLAGTFWPDESESAARRRLSQALWQLQTALQEVDGAGELIATTVGEIRVDQDALWLDVAEFDALMATANEREESLAEIADLMAAVELYRGDFLAGFYDEWADVERARLRLAYLDGLWRLVALYKSRADYESSLAFARRLTLHDPLREEAHREVMRLSFLLGRSNEALSQYERCAQILREELGTEPDNETKQLRANIAELRDKGERPFAPAADAPLLAATTISLIGRDEPRRQVLKRFEHALVGRGGVVMVEGPSGVGKTRLLEEVADDAQWRGLSVMRVECSEEDQLAPYASLRIALESGLSRLRAEQLGALLHRLTLADLARVVPRVREWLPGLPEPVPEEAEAGPERLHRAIGQALFALAEINPSVLMIDDAQWADEASLQLLAELAPDLEHQSLLLYLSYRDADARERAEVWSQLLAIDAATQVERVTLEPLDLGDATRFIEESLGVSTVPADTAEGLFLETGGNPLLLLETLRTWHAETQSLTLGDEPGVLALDHAPASGGIAQVVSRRFAGLDPAARATLEAVAVVGRAQDPALIGAVAGLDREVTLAAFDVLIGRGALVESPDGYTFTHHQVRAVTLETMDPDRAAELHAATATELERREPERIEALALHYAEAGIDDKAAAYAVLAGDRAFGLAAFDAASRHYRAAASRTTGLERFGVLMHLDASLDVLGLRADQRDVLTEAADLDPSSAELAWRRARLEDHEGNHLTAIAHAETAVAATVDARPSERRPALRTMGLVLSHAGRQADAVPFLEDAVSLSTQDPVTEARALTDLGNVMAQAQMYGAASQALQRALDRYGQVGNLFGTVETSGELAIVFMEQGDTDRAIELYESALGVAREVGHRKAAAVNLINLGNAKYVTGDLAGSLEAYSEAAELVDEMGDYRNAAFLRANLASVRHTMLGDDSVEADVLTSLEFFRAEEHAWGEAFCREHLASIALRRGDLKKAQAQVDAGLKLLDGGANQWVEVHLRRLAAEIALAGGEHDAAEEQALTARQLAEELGLTDVVPTLVSLIAVVVWHQGRSEEALALAEEATSSLEPGSERPYLIWYRRFVIEDGMGRGDEAATSLRQAVTLLEAALATLDDAARTAALVKVPEHAAIAEARDRSEARTVTVELPSAAAPSGRPLHDDEWVTVVWTVSEPADLAIDGAADRRRKRIERLVEEAAADGAAVRIPDLAAALEVSVATIRRDLAALRSAGHEIVTRRGH